MKLIAFITEPITIRALLTHRGEPAQPPPLAPRARAPPEPEFVHTEAFAFDADPGFQFDQTVAP